MVQATSPEAPDVPPLPSYPPRPYGLPGLVISLAAVALAGAAWFAVLGAVVFAIAFVLGGVEGVLSLAGLFGGLDARALARAEPATQRAFFGVLCLIYLAGLGGLLSVARWRGGRQFGALLGWSGAFPQLQRQHWPLLLVVPAYYLLAGGLLRFFYPDYAVWRLLPRDPLAMLLSLALIAGLAPLVEELLFRGWIFGVLREKFPARATIALCTLLFALAHLDRTGLYSVAVLLPGYALTFLRERTGSVKPCILGHALYNFVGWALLLIAGLATGQ